MIDSNHTRKWVYRGVFFLLCCTIIFVQLLPLSTIPRSVPGPDFLFALTAVWLMRRPRWAPVLVIVVVHLMADILFLRPIGLWSAISLLGYEFLRHGAMSSPEESLPFEIAMVGATFAAMILVCTTIQFVLGVTELSLGALVMHVLFTIAIYPVVIAFCHYVIGVRRARPTDFDATQVSF